MHKFLFILGVICVAAVAQEISDEPEVSEVALESEVETIVTESPLLEKEEDNRTVVDENGKNLVTVSSELDEGKVNTTTESATQSATKVNCLMNKEYGPVELVNASRLMELLILEPGPGNKTRTAKEGKQMPGTCILVLFYASWCIFSSQTAPHFNAMPRFFPHMKMVAIDAIKYQSFNTQYGIVGVPTLMLIHNGKPISKFNGTEYNVIEFARFIIYSTNLPLGPAEQLYVKSTDYAGPVPSTPSDETDYFLMFSWTFIVACSLYFTSKSRWWRQFVELVQNTWRESAAQHEHAD